MQYVTIPATHTQTRVYPVFHFWNLPDSVQEAIIERDKENPPYDLFAMLLIDDFDLDISEHFVPKLKEYGITVDTHDVRTMGGKTRQEPSVFWETEPIRVWFEGAVNAETFLSITDISRYSDIGAMLTADPYIRLETERHGRQSVDITFYNVTDSEKRERLERDFETLEQDILETYRNLTREMTDSLRSQYDYLGSDSWYRDERLEGNKSETLYLIDGTEFES